MRVLNIQNGIKNQQNLNSKKKAVAFTATPEQILHAVKRAEICPGKTRFLKQLGKDFRNLSKGLRNTETSKLEYKLGEHNITPDVFVDTIDGDIWEELDDILNESAFSCGSGKHCNCGKDMSKGKFASELLKMLGVENPHVITLNRPEKRKFSLFNLFK